MYVCQGKVLSSEWIFAESSWYDCSQNSIFANLFQNYIWIFPTCFFSKALERTVHNLEKKSRLFKKLYFKTKWEIFSNFSGLLPVKLNTGKKFCLNLHLVCIIKCLFFFLEIPSCGKKVIFVTEIVILCKSPPFKKVKWFRRKWLPHVWILKIFSLLFLGPKGKFEFFIYCTYVNM